MIEEWNQGYAPQMADCPAFNEPLLYEAPDGSTVQMACPSIGVVYAPPLTLTALAELLWPDSWSLLPPT